MRRTKQGKRIDLENQYFRSAWEANYARYLNWLCRQKKIKDWQYEPRVFRFEGVTRGPYTYTPDFAITTLDGSIVYHEVKGWMDSASRSRLKRFARFYPELTLEVIDHVRYKQLHAMGKIFSPMWE